MSDKNTPDAKGPRRLTSELGYRLEPNAATGMTIARYVGGHPDLDVPVGKPYLLLTHQHLAAFARNWGMKLFMIPWQHVEQVAVLTRATINWRRLWAFWRTVPAASRAAQGAEGLRFSLGLGELPLVRQATFSVWNSLTEMQRFAYHSEAHRVAIQRTRTERWYSEELFARFRVLASAPLTPDTSAADSKPGG